MHSCELSTDLVEVAVQPGHPVMQQVPGEALKVEQQQAGQHLDQQVTKVRSLLGQVDRNQAPAHQRQWEDEDQVVVECQSQAATHRGPADVALGLQLVSTHQGTPGGQDVQQQEREGQGQEDRH